MKSPTLEQRSETAWKRAMDTTYATEQAYPWQEKLAMELNVILARVIYSLETSSPKVEAVDVEFAEAALSVVARVAEFEDIRRA